ncbi:MAG: hypothetical protein NTW08_02370 [Gammaproteobacteria bacterium]|nr:hypothetical protein [Gammaproteobacteria bacterium]
MPPRPKSNEELRKEQAVQDELNEAASKKKKAENDLLLAQQQEPEKNTPSEKKEDTSMIPKLLSIKPDLFEVAIQLFKEQFPNHPAPEKTKNKEGQEVLKLYFKDETEAQSYFKSLAGKNLTFRVTDNQGNELYQSLGDGRLQKKVDGKWEQMEVTHQFKEQLPRNDDKPTTTPAPTPKVK